MTIRKLTLAAAFVGLTAACENQPLAVAPEADVPATFAANPSVLNRQLAEIRAATARFHDVDVALSAGYQKMSECVAHPQLGAMGFHYGRPDLMNDADFSYAEPEMLLYMPRADGSLKLVGVEYLIFQHVWLAAGRTGEPTFLDHPFDFTPAGHMPARYSLHVWTWQPNPAGLFAPFNPRLSCDPPAGGA
jgi:hypothetical protein